MKFVRRNYLIFIGFFVFFIFGYYAFVGGSYRFGVHPFAWRALGARSALQGAIRDCFSGNDADRTKFMICAQKKLVQDMSKWGTRAFMQELADTLGKQSSDRNFTQCHDLAHAIGWAGTMSSKSVQLTMPQCTNTCVSGCQHGAVSAWYGMGNDLKSSITSLCIKGVDWSGNIEAQGGCFHEVGHAVADVASYDMKASLQLCDQIIPQGRISCAAGVFMEMFEAATFAQTPKPVPQNNPEWCSELWAPYDAYCYDRSGSYEYSRNQDAHAAFAVCDVVPALYRSTCVSGIGQNIFYVYQHNNDYLHDIENFCRQARGDLYISCISGLIRSSVFVEPDAHTAHQLCNSLDASQKKSCFGIIGGVLEEYKPKAEKIRICETMPVAYKKTCASGVIQKN